VSYPPKTLSSRSQTLSQLQPVNPPQATHRHDQERLPAPATPPRRQKDRFSLPIGAEQAVQNRSIGTLVGRAQARYRLIRVQCTKSAQSGILFSHYMGTPRILRGPRPNAACTFQPDIPQNTGTILRLCACLNVGAHIIEPAGFPVSDRHFRRAGMDYLDHVMVMRHDSWSKFEQWRNERGQSAGSCSRPRRPAPIWTIAMMRPTSCCSGANPPASPTRSPQPPMRGW